MLIRISRRSDIKESQLSDEKVYQQRRFVIKALGLSVLSIPLASTAQAGLFDIFSDKEKSGNSDSGFKRSALSHLKNSHFQSLTPLTPEEKILQYNNFYEFGTGKGDPFIYAQQFKVDPWSLTVDGLVDKPVTLYYEDLLTRFGIEERFYRMRCVEAWSMNIPWLGFSLASLIKLVSPKSAAKYVRFETLYDPEQMRGQRSSRIGGGLDYPYLEGLRLDEALHPLTLLSVGLYGKTLAPQNGAPIRLVVPWKYGFKSIKSIVRITLTDKEPLNTWQKTAPSEYGFYANVNPAVDHPRWSQASERFIGAGNLFAQKRQATLAFNGYQEEVAQLYKNLDLKRNF